MKLFQILLAAILLTAFPQQAKAEFSSLDAELLAEVLTEAALGNGNITVTITCYVNGLPVSLSTTCRANEALLATQQLQELCTKPADQGGMGGSLTPPAPAPEKPKNEIKQEPAPVKGAQ